MQKRHYKRKFYCTIYYQRYSWLQTHILKYRTKANDNQYIDRYIITAWRFIVYK